MVYYMVLFCQLCEGVEAKHDNSQAKYMKISQDTIYPHLGFQPGNTLLQCQFAHSDY